MILRNVAMPQANYQLKYISASQDRLDEIWKPLEKVWTSGLHRSRRAAWAGDWIGRLWGLTKVVVVLLMLV